MEKKCNDILSEVAVYYSAKLAEHGTTPLGVDWNSEESQILRFEQLTKVIRHTQGFSINDLGCGYGALVDYLETKYREFVYTGCDVSRDMIRAAKTRHAARAKIRFVQAPMPIQIADYGIASGIFNVRLSRRDDEWIHYIGVTLDALDRTSHYGFAFNCLTSYSDSNKMRGYLYYADPCNLFDLCKKRYSKHVALMHDYGLYEFTIIVRKET
jgi:SAM-dependent methyltransferase